MNKVDIKELNGVLVNLYKVSISLDKGYLLLCELIDILFTKARELNATPLCLIPRNQRLLIYFKRREGP